MKKITMMMLAAVLTAVPLLAAEVKLGKPVDVKQSTAIADLLSHPESYVGKTVKVEGKITEVCQMMMCWIKVQNPKSKAIIQIKVNDGDIVFPKDGAGKTAVAQGEFVKIVLTKDQYIAQLKHEAEESGKKVDTSKITEGKAVYRINGQGAVIH